MQSILVGSDLKGCAFVYGSLSFLDKVSCGLAVFALQSFQSKSSPIARSFLSFPCTESGEKNKAGCGVCMEMWLADYISI